MNKTEVVKAIASNTGISQANVKTVLDGFEDVVTAELKAGENKVVIPGFLTFESKAKAARTGRNPATGKTLQIAATTAVLVKAGKTLKDTVKG